jgi:hypothetical protein
MLFGRDAAFDGYDHDLYDLQEGSHELMNLALGRGLRHDMRVLASQNCGQWKVQSTRTAFNFQKPRPYEHFALQSLARPRRSERCTVKFDRGLPHMPETA